MTNWNDADNPFAKAGATSPGPGNGAWHQKPLEVIKFADMHPRLDAKPLIKGYLEQGQVSLIVGEKGCGKTFLALDRDLHIAAGYDWFGCKVSPGPVVYVAVEAGRSIQNRVAAWRREHGLENSDIPFAAITSPVDLCHAQNGDVDRLIAAIKATCFDKRLALVEIDTVNRAMAGGNENSPDDMGSFIHSLDLLRETLRCHVSSVHHFGKDAGRGGRGHSSLVCAVDTETQVQNRTAVITHQRDGVAGKEFPFKLRQVTLGYDEDGDPVTSCIVEAANATASTEPNSRKIKLSVKQQIALDTLRRALDAHGKPAPANNYIPASATVIDQDLWRRIYLSATSGDEQPEDTRRKAWRESRDALMAKHVIDAHASLVWTLV